MPIEILQKEVQVRDPTTHQFSDLAALRGGQGIQGPTSIEVSSTQPTDPNIKVWFQEQDTPVEVYEALDIDNMRGQMESNLAYINTGSTADKTYYKGDYLIYNGQLYIVTATEISQNVTLNSGQNGNIRATNAGDELSNLNIAQNVSLTGSQYWNVGMQASSAKRIGHLVSLQIYGRVADTKVPRSSNDVFTAIGHIDCLPISMIAVLISFNEANFQFKIDTNGDILLYNYNTTAYTVPNVYICFLAY